MAGRGVELPDRIGNWKQAFDSVAAELTPNELRERMNVLLSVPLPDDPDNVITYTARMNTAMALARLIAANDRAAATVAALLTATGIKPAAIDYGDDT